MSILTILEFPDPRLRKKAAPIGLVDHALRKIIDAMFEIMYAAPGIGLAATQVNIHKRFLILDVSEEHNRPQVFVNPEITILDSEPFSQEEGCLSVPGVFELIERPQKIHVAALNRDGEEFELEAEGLLAVCLQHEVDHLNGKLFVDYLSALKRQRIKSRLEKEHRESAQDPGSLPGKSIRI